MRDRFLVGGCHAGSPRMSIWEGLLPAVVRAYAERATHVQDHYLLAGYKNYVCNCPEQAKLC